MPRKAKKKQNYHGPSAKKGFAKKKLQAAQNSLKSRMQSAGHSLVNTEAERLSKHDPHITQ